MKNAIKKIMAFVLVIAMIAGVLPSVFAASDYVEPFKDVKTTDWFAPYVTYVYEHNPQLMNGMTENTFEPNGTCTRAMAAVILYRLADPVIPSVKPATFTDLDPTQSWYMNGISWAQQNGVVNGVTEKTFVPEGLVQREQLVTMIWRYAGKPEVEDDYLKDFRDKEKISVYAREAFNWAISLGIIGGTPEKMLNPQGNATRAEVAKIISVFAEETAPCQHNWGEGQVTKAATCTETGIMTYTCSLCGETKTEVIPMTAHNYVDGVCSVCGAKEPSTPVDPPVNPPVDGDDFVLSASIKGGDEVVIYNPGHGMAIKNETDNDWYLMPETVTPTDNKIVSPDASLVWTVVDNGNGTFSFVNGANKIMMWLSESNGKTYFELTNNADYPDATGEWKIISGDASNNLYYIQHSTLSNSYGPAYIECFYNANKDTTKISGYSSSNPTANDFGFQFYVKGAEAPEPPVDPPVNPPVTGDEYALVSEIKDGDEVVIYNPGHGMAIKNETDNNWYLMPETVTPTDNKIVSPDASLVWTVVDNGNGTFSFVNGANKIMMWLSESNGKTYFELTNDADYPDATGEWKIISGDASNNLYYIQHSTLSNSYGPAYIECFYNANKDTTKISGYSSSNPTANDFGFQFFVKGAEAPETPVDPPVNPPVTGDEYALVSEIKDGDEVVIYNPGHGMAIKNETDNNWYLMPETVTPTDNKIVSPDASLVWTVVDNGNGTFSFVNGANKIMMWLSESNGKTYFELTNNADYPDATGEWKIISGDASNNLYYIQHSTLSNNYGPAYIECYYNANKDTTKISGYSSSNPTANDFGFQFFVKGAEAPETPVDPPVDPVDPPVNPEGYVAIYNPANSVVMTTEVNTYTSSSGTTKDQFMSAAATLADGKLTTAAENVALFKIETVDGVTTFKTQDGKYLYADGTNVRLVDTESEYTRFVLEDTTGGQFIKCETAQFNGKAQYIEYYASKGVFSVFGMGADTSIYTFAFYELAASDTPVDPPVDPVDPPVNPEGYVAIYNPANSVVMTTEVNTYTSSSGTTKDQFMSAAATLADGKLTTAAENVALFKIETVNGVTTFKTQDGKYLYADGTNVRLVDTESEYTRFVLEDTTGGQFIKCETAQFNGKAQYIEYYASKGVFSVFGMGADTSIYTFAFYELAASDTPVDPPVDPVDPPVDPVDPPVNPEGYVAIYNPANSVVMTTEVNTYTSSSGTTKDQFMSAAATLADGKLTTAAENVALFKIETVNGVTTFKTQDGKYLYADGTNVRLVDTESEYTRFVLEDTTGGQFIKCETAQYNGKAQYIEYYASKGVFSVFGMGADTSIYTFAFYELQGSEPACEHEWDNGEVTTEPWCTVAGEKTFTCELCGDTRTEVILALGHIDEDNNDMCDRCRANLAAGDYSIAESVAAGDKIIIVAEFEGKYYAVVNDNTTVKNALNAIEVNVTSEGLVTPDGADLLWEICEGEEGTFTLKSSDGKYISNTSGSTTKLSDTGTSYVITCGEGSSKITLPGNVGRSLMLRVNAGVPQFRNYSDSNATKSGYSAVITIWKAN